MAEFFEEFIPDDLLPGERPEFFRGRCNPCEYAKPVVGTGQWTFLGCYCKPYRGKWVKEIKDCPKEVSDNG